MNNKGFAITTIIYGVMILFLMLLVSMLGILSTHKDRLEKLIDSHNGARDIINGNTVTKPILMIYNTNGGEYIGTRYSVDEEGNIICSEYERDRRFTYPNLNNKPDLMDPYTTDYIYIVKSGYVAKEGEAWNTEPDGSGTSFNELIAVQYNILRNYAIETEDYYVLKVYVNWVEETVQ